MPSASMRKCHPPCPGKVFFLDVLGQEFAWLLRLVDEHHLHQLLYKILDLIVLDILQQGRVHRLSRQLVPHLSHGTDTLLPLNDKATLPTRRNSGINRTSREQDQQRTVCPM